MYKELELDCFSPCILVNFSEFKMAAVAILDFIEFSIFGTFDTKGRVVPLRGI